MLQYVEPKSQERLAESESELTSEKGDSFPIVNDIPRFVPSENYAAAFGLQWNTFTHTQLDSKTSHPISKERLERCYGDKLENLKGKNILEAGCGAGRFTEHFVKSGANTHAIDFSNAVEANAKNMGNPPNYKVAQASIMELPFKDESFDVVFCIGVIQHTPNPEYSIKCLWDKVKPGGLLVIDHYTYSLSMVTKLAWVYRAFLKEMKPAKSKKAVDRLTDIFFPFHWAVRKIFPLQALLSRISPCLFYYKTFPYLTKEQHYELTKLDTYDHLTDYYKHLRTGGQIKRTLSQLGGKNIWINKGGNGVEARAKK